MPNFKPIYAQVCQAGFVASVLLGTVGTVAITPAIAQTTQTSVIAQTIGRATDGRVTATPAPGLTTAGMTFKQAMTVGYTSSRRGDFNTALINFQRALMIQPGNPYAAAAADNMAYYIQYERVSTRQRSIDRLQARLNNAIAQQDWVCAATTIDELTTYTVPNSLNRERLIGQRGDVSGLLDARLNHERWSTVCAASNPVY